MGSDSILAILKLTVKKVKLQVFLHRTQVLSREPNRPKYHFVLLSFIKKIANFKFMGFI